MLRTALVLVGVLTALAHAEPGSPGPATVFESHCASCHGPRGRSDTPSARVVKAKPLAGDRALARMEPAAIVQLIRANPKHQGVGAPVDLDDAEIRAAATYVRMLARDP